MARERKVRLLYFNFARIRIQKWRHDICQTSSLVVILDDFQIHIALTSPIFDPILVFGLCEICTFCLILLYLFQSLIRILKVTR